MMSYQGKNYRAQGGDEWVIGGKLTFLQGAEITGGSLTTVAVATTTEAGTVIVGEGLAVENDGTLSLDLTPAENQAASTATDVAGLKADLNALLAKLKAAGLMEADAAAEANT